MDTESYEAYTKIELQRGHAEFDVVRKAFRKTIERDKYQINKICKIQNLTHWNKYTR